MPFYPPSRPRPVEGGLTARSTRGAIGATWWSQRFIGVLEGFALGSRLTRGRSYARRGQVISLTVGPGVVIARVQGSRATPYKVVLGLAPFPSAVWAELDAALAAEALHAAALLAGQFPAELETVFASRGTRLFPSSVDELRMACSCPDWEVPCKHIAASFYLLAERFDEDPFEILHWRGRPRGVLLDRIREMRSADADQAEGAGPRPRADRARSGRGGDADRDDPDRDDADRDGSRRPGAGPAGVGGTESPAPGPGSVAGALTALADLPDTAPSPVMFWVSPVPLPPREAPADAPVDLLLHQLPDPPAALGSEAFPELLRRVYAALPDRDDPDATPSGRRRG